MKGASVATLVLLTLVGGWLRFTAIDFGLPDKFRPDEEYLVSRAVGFRGSANPHFAVYPAAQMYLQHGVLRAVAWVEGHEGDFREAFRKDGFARAHLVGRRVSAGFGTATIPAMYWAVLPYGAPAALASAAVTTFATIHVRESKYSTTDAPAVFWLTLAIGMLLRIVFRGQRTDSFLAGVFTGLAMGTKYPTGAILAGMALAHIEARHREGRSFWRVFRDIRPYMTLITALTVFVAVTPYLLLDWEQTLKDFAYQRGFLEKGVGNAYSGWGWSWLVLKAFPDGLGPVLAIVLASALLWNIARPRRGLWSLLAFVTLACVGITSSRYTFYRYILVPLPALILFLGTAVGDGWRILGRFAPRPWATAVATIAVAVILVPVTIRDYKLNRLLSRRDTRTMAREWIFENIPRGSAIAMTHDRTPYGKPQLRGAYRAKPFQSPARSRRQGVRWVLSDSTVLPFYSPGPTEAQLAALEQDAALVFEVNPVKPDTPEPVFDQGDAFYVPLRRASSIKRPGPRIRIWELPPPTGEPRADPPPDVVS